MVASINIALLLASAIGVALAAPTSLAATKSLADSTLLPRGKTFSVTAVHNDKFVRNGTSAMLKAYAKYGLHSLNADSILKRQDGSVTATPATQDTEYTCPVTIGGQTLNLDFDTGSADLWVFSSLLPSSDLQGHSYYDSTQSSTYQELSGYSWQISYADGSSASGIVGTDTVTIGGTTVQTQAVELAQQASSAFLQGSNDGLVGFAFSSINTVQPQSQSTFFDNAQSSLDAPIFAAYLPYQASGAYDFGATDNSKYSGDIVYAAVDSSQGFWQFSSESYQVGSDTFDASGTVGIADTGTTLILMQDSQVSQYYSGVSGAQLDNSQGGYTFPCDAALPTLSFLIGPSDYATISAQYLNFGPTESGGSTCFGGLQSVGSGNQNIYGDVFFNAYYGVFDASVPQFGFAPTTGGN